MLDTIHHIHFIGIGGSGVSSLAYLAQAKGLKVTGSDVAESPVTGKLRNEGITVFIGHEAKQLGELTELVVYSEAIDREKNPEFLEAEKRGIRTLSYFSAIGEISRHKKTVAVVGTHGKTTTTAMLGQALAEAGADPTVIVGAQVPAFDDRNIRIGHSEWFVVEGCEYRRSFLSLRPFGVVLLNCEPEHLDYYKDEADYVSAFEALVKKIPEEGFLVFNQTDKNAVKVSGACAGQRIPVDRPLGIELSVPGDFNRWNAAHAYAAGVQVSPDLRSESGLKRFTGAARRMEVKGEKDGVTVVDDYAHHPTEIRVTLKALREKYPDKRIICVFQPHQYSRTYKLLEDFKGAFGDADQVLIPNIYEARDSHEDKSKINAMALAENISQTHPAARWTEDFEKTVEILKQTTQTGDVVVTMGAGDVYQVGELYLK